ncbi:MAG: MoaD/ThiS family protein [Candidatus Marinimicrobia bacterium]|jgi:molybdopterin synthase sulfur carrier subunit|nr:MoaD/ThiS family protein [Candidatus Neomarinimicrobiota bacterium]MDP6853679.1 MoaD/ThiS family protein [Candidatus Neomarinimicrobiota bacterium]MDP6937025.1 MoaD/ThiS family protein [Candidatus Neomarinimicrobiota bacterium]
MLTIQIRNFSLVKEALSRDRIELELPEGATVGSLLTEIRKLNPEKLSGLPVRAAVNHEYAEESKILRNMDEVALIPPVSGG